MRGQKLLFDSRVDSANVHKVIFVRLTLPEGFSYKKPWESYNTQLQSATEGRELGTVSKHRKCSSRVLPRLFFRVRGNDENESPPGIMSWKLLQPRVSHHVFFHCGYHRDEQLSLGPGAACKRASICRSRRVGA